MEIRVVENKQLKKNTRKQNTNNKKSSREQDGSWPRGLSGAGYHHLSSTVWFKKTIYVYVCVFVCVYRYIHISIYLYMHVLL